MSFLIFIGQFARLSTHLMTDMSINRKITELFTTNRFEKFLLNFVCVSNIFLQQAKIKISKRVLETFYVIFKIYGF